jgi:hypothetical protein
MLVRVYLCVCARVRVGRGEKFEDQVVCKPVISIKPDDNIFILRPVLRLPLLANCANTLCPREKSFFQRPSLVVSSTHSAGIGDKPKTLVIADSASRYTQRGVGGGIVYYHACEFTVSLSSKTEDRLVNPPSGVICSHNHPKFHTLRTSLGTTSYRVTPSLLRMIPCLALPEHHVGDKKRCILGNTVQKTCTLSYYRQHMVSSG